MRSLATLRIVLPIICLALSPASFAQAQSGNQVATKFDEFGDIYLTDIKARADGFAIALQNQPNARGFIIIYRARRDPPGLNSRLARRIRTYLVYSRGIPAERVVAVDGGVAGCLTQEFWIVPAGTAPKPRDDAYSNEIFDSESASIFDEYYYALPQDTDVGEDDIVGNSLDAFADALRKHPRTQGYIIVYPRYYIERWQEYDDEGRATKKGRRLRLDSPGTAQKVLKEVKAELVNKYRIAASRVKVMDGGYRKLREVELWLVPRGVHAPIPTPNAFPKRRR